MNDADTAPAEAAAPSHPTPTTPPPVSQISPGFPTPTKIADQTTQLHDPALSQKHQAALNRLFAGEDDRFICQALKIDRKTLYNWKTHHPAFRAELARRNTEVWTDVLATVRATVIDAVSTLRDHLHTPTERMTQLRAARALIQLVHSPRLAPTEPTTITGVLDLLLRTTHPPTPASTTAPTPTAFSDAQRQALLDQLLAENATIERESDAARDARRKPSPVVAPVAAPTGATVAAPSPSPDTPGEGEGLPREPERATTP